MNEENKVNGTQEELNNENTQGTAPAEGNKPADPANAGAKKSLGEKAKEIWNSKPAKAVRKGVKYTAIGVGGILALIGAAGVVKAVKDSSPTPETSDAEQETDQQEEPETEQPEEETVEDPEA